MAEASGLRWTTLRVAALYPLALLYVLASELVFHTVFYAIRPRAPGGAAIVGLIAAGAAALGITRVLNLDLPAWAVAVAAYAVGGVAAACVFGYFQLLRREFPPRREWPERRI